MTELLIPGHPSWDEFIERMSGEEGCNFVEDDKGITWHCPHDHSKPLARAILQTYPNVDVDKSIEYYEEHGGLCCDCEIVFNVG